MSKGIFFEAAPKLSEFCPTAGKRRTKSSSGKGDSQFRRDRIALPGKAVVAEMQSNELYLAVLPLIHLGSEFGKTEETLTLFPDRNFATEFFPDEVEGYLSTFKNRISYLIGGHSKKYDVYTENTDEGRVIVRVVQHVG